MKKLGIERSLVGPGLVSSLLRTELTLSPRPLYFKFKVCKPTTYSSSSLIIKEHVTPEVLLGDLIMEDALGHHKSSKPLKTLPRGQDAWGTAPAHFCKDHLALTVVIHCS